MTDDPYPSIQPLINSLVGGFIAFMTIAAPLCVICDFNFVQSSVTINKISYKTLLNDCNLE